MGPIELAIRCHEGLTHGVGSRLLQGLAAGVPPAGLGDVLSNRRLDPEVWRALKASMADPRWQQLLEEVERGGLMLLRPDMACYPTLLGRISNPPDPVFARGRLDVAQGESVAVVGTRHPDEAGRRWTRCVADGLARVGFTVASGGAAGIDGEAHRAAGIANTIAVVGAGFAHPYPLRHKGLLEAISREGLLLSEWPPWVEPISWRFPRRNRVIAGLSRAVVVVQAPLRSGALITARHAVDEGREVLVCPGDTQNPLYQGNHALIRDGARLAAGLEDVLEDLDCLPLEFLRPAPLPSSQDIETPVTSAPVTGAMPSGADEGLWRALDQPRCRDELVALLQVGPGVLAGRLLAEELAGNVHSLPGDRWTRRGASDVGL